LRSAAVESEASPLTGGFQRFSWEGDLLWEFYMGPQHHDIEPLPNGNVLVIKNDLRSAVVAKDAGRDPDLLDNPNLRSLSILEIQQAGLDSGVVVWEWHAWDHLVQDYDSSYINYGDPSDHPELIDINFVKNGAADWLHTNSVDYNPELDQILVSNRNTNEIWIIDHSTSVAEAASHAGGNSGKGGDLLFRWGNPAAYGAGDSTDQQLFEQHDARWVEPGHPGEGNISIFSNGNGRPVGEYSSIEEIIPPLDSLGNYSLLPGTAFGPELPSWTYLAENPSDFMADRYGGAHRLPNGNTLICSPLEGRLFEVTLELEIVWEYINPVSTTGILYQGDTPALNSIFRGERYAPDYAGFSGKDLTAGDPIELYPNAVVGADILPEAMRLYPAFPNPFNPSTTIYYSLAQATEIRVSIFNIRGELVDELVKGLMPQGDHKLLWGPRNGISNKMSSGVYVIRLETTDSSRSQKLLYLK